MTTRSYAKQAEAALSPQELVITLDFNGHPEVYQAIAEAAREQVRLPEHQILFELMKTMIPQQTKTARKVKTPKTRKVTPAPPETERG